MDSLSGLFENGTGHTVVVVHSPRARTATDAKKPRGGRWGERRLLMFLWWRAAP